MTLAPKTIYAKGLVLISVPLVVELVFAVTLFNVQRYYDEKLNKERSALEIIFHANEMWINCTEVMLLKGYYTLFGGPKPDTESRESRLLKEYRILRDFLVNNQRQAANLEMIRNGTYQALDMAKQLVPLEGLPAAGKMAALKANLKTFTQVYNEVNTISPRIRYFGRPQFFHSPKAAEEVGKATAFVDSFVLISLACSVLVAVLLFVYFIRTINSALAVMVDNTERFRRGEELRPPLGGEDELAKVDAGFHNMVDEIREAQRTRQAVMAMISHDLRSPLTSVLGYFSLLTSGAFGDPPPQAMVEAQSCEKNVERLIRLITDLLDLEKIEAGKLTLRPKMMPVKQVIDRAISATILVADENEVIVRGTPTSAEIYGDPDRIVQALANLVSTAVRFSPAGSYVDVSAAQEDDAVEIRVTSVNAAVPQARLDALFDRYQQKEESLRLELPISKEIVKLHNGTIGALSQNGHGCTFWVRVPAHAPSQEATAVAG
ncbi:MAG TPA: HAMP domain-containing sensor histidine kinase [Candidatus Obscuribacterales bacterium]